MWNNSALHIKELESHHKRDVIIYQLAATASDAGDDSYIKEIYDDTDVIILLINFCIQNQKTVKTA